MGRIKGGTNRKYSFEEKLNLCKKYYEEHSSSDDLAKEVGIPRGTLSRWLIDYHNRGEEGLKLKKRGRPTPDKTVLGMSELERTKLENLALKVEVERLKKGYTVKGVGSKKAYVTLDGKIIKS